MRTCDCIYCAYKTTQAEIEKLNKEIEEIKGDYTKCDRLEQVACLRESKLIEEAVINLRLGVIINLRKSTYPDVHTAEWYKAPPASLN